MIWQDYQRHETKQPEKLLEFLKRMEEEVGIAPHNCRIFITGSGGGALCRALNHAGDFSMQKYVLNDVQRIQRRLVARYQARSPSDWAALLLYLSPVHLPQNVFIATVDRPRAHWCRIATCGIVASLYRRPSTC